MLDNLEQIDKVNERALLIAVIPAYNEAKNIAEIILRTRPFVDEVIVCDDGSTDMTGEICRALKVKLISHEQNIGKGASLRDLFKIAKEFDPSVVVCIDADGQHDPKDIPKLVQPVLSGSSNIVIGSRFLNGSKTDAPLYRRIGLRLFNGHRKEGNLDTQSGFRAFDINAVNVMMQGETNGYGSESEQLSLAAKYGLRVSEVPIEIKYNGIGKTSKKNPVLHGAEVISTLLRLVVEERPLFFLGIPSSILIIGGIISGAYLFFYYNSSQYFSIPLALLFIGGITIGILLAIGAMILYAFGRLKIKLK